MPPPLNMCSFARAIPLRPRPQAQWLRPVVRMSSPQLRTYSDSKEPLAADRSKRIDSQPLPHVSEEAATMAEITGGEGPDLSQGTPIEEVLQKDKAAQDKLPEVMKQRLQNKPNERSLPNQPPKGSRSYSTSMTPLEPSGVLDTALLDFKPPTTMPQIPGLKFEAPVLPIPKDAHVKHRYDPVVEQVTNLLMRHGKKSVAQRDMALILQHLRTSAIPTINPARPLLAGAPPPSHLPLNPILYLTLAIDSIAPLLRIRSQKGAAGGGVALQLPIPLGQRQRRRTAVQWILSSASKRRNMGSGKGGYAQRVASEIIAVVEGRSNVWERRNAIHKLGVSARANLIVPRRR